LEAKKASKEITFSNKICQAEILDRKIDIDLDIPLD
jgi:hypothetical protein